MIFSAECWDSAIISTVLHFYLLTFSIFIFTFRDAAVSSSAGMTDVLKRPFQGENNGGSNNNNNKNNNDDHFWGGHHSPQSGKRGAAHGGCEYAAKVIVGKSCVHQSNRLVFFVIRCGDPPVRTCIPRIRIPARLHGTQSREKDMKPASAETCTAEERGRRARDPLYLAVALLLLRHLRHLVIVQVLQILKIF